MRRSRRRAPRAAPAVAPAVALAALGLAPALAAVLVPARAARAQAPAAQGVVTGVVTAASSQRPVADAQVVVEGTTLGATTDASGRFRIAGAPAGEVRLVVRRIGFQPRTVAARAGQLVQVALADRVLELNQVVVTGTAGAAERRAVGNAVSQVRAAEVVATQPVRNVQDLLTGRAAGVSVVGSSGQVGTGSRVRVRGASSLSLGNDPLIYVDGVRVDNQQASGPQNQAFGSASISRLNDFNPDDIESLEVIKGPAAATLYGTEASNGVIQIITKRGAAGRTTWNYTGRGGANWLPNWRTRFYTNYGVVQRPGGTARDTVTIDVGQLNDSLNARFGNDIFRTGGLQDHQLSLSGGTTAARYFVSGGYEDNQGVERVNRQTRGNVRLNVTAAPSAKVEVQSSLGYTAGRTVLPYESGGGGATWATYFASPCFRYRTTIANSGGVCTDPGAPQLGFRSGPPNVYYQAYNLFQDVGRFTGSVQATHRPASWFDHRVVFGLDRLEEDNQTQSPRNDFIFATYPAFTDVGGSDSTAGGLTVGTRGVNYVSADYAANARYAIPGLGGWRGVTSAGGQYYGRRTRVRSASATGFPAAGLLSLNSGLVPSLPADTLTENNTIGGYVQQQLIWRDRLFVTGAVRRDDNSAFGTNYPAVTYPKVSVSYVASEEPALRLPERVFSSLRLRAAYGGSGLQPGAFDAIRSYDAGGGLLTPSNIGNADLGPERSYETELGVDAGLLGDRLGAELTYFDGTTRDAILSRQAPPSAGFPGFQLFNAGRVDRRGLEWTLRATPVRAERFSLDVTVNGSATRYDIRSLASGSDTVSLSGQVAHVVGRSPGAWFDRRVVSGVYDSVTRTVPNASLRCDDGRGGAVPCYTGSALTAPRVFLGNSVPTREGSVAVGANLLRQFRLNAFVDYRGGYKKLDGNRRVRCNLFSLCRENYYPGEFDAVTLAEVQRSTAFAYTLIQDASFVRFRELSLSYTLAPSLARRLRAGTAAVTVAGRNLGLATNYGGVEPEASFNGGTRGGAFGQWEQNVLPQTRSFVATLTLTF
jgi:TonB-linked SusC/RagA family outer membrane protein